MFHASTLQLIACWRERRGARPAPSRADIQLADVGRLAPWCFIAQADPDGDIRFRLAGEKLIDLHGRLLARESVPALWRPAHRPLLIRALAASLTAAEPVVTASEGVAQNGAAVRLETLLAPLAAPDGRRDRLLGLCVPLSQGFEPPLGELELLAVNGAEASEHRPALRLAAADGHRIG